MEDSTPQTGERTPPRERFAHDFIQFDLLHEAEALAAEAHKGQSGHRQITLYKNGPASVSLFRFEQGGAMPVHQTNGTVTIQVLQGRLTMTVQGESLSLPTGSLLALSPTTPHDVTAEEPTIMLLTVSLTA